ncbi:MAG: hypothetical protein WC194_02280 [Mesotoga sp.]|jgi:hypothetical protein|uniref:hypothetical protein n=1 Tax=Mesotoga sp. TaxID=2053577 RepID=UPI00261CDF43|nr:hypothetical protein [Mesotoga sp.]MDD3680605.1 hypothetical protein [Mesotoga sp.]MDD4207304.1 hypothetical protein [Mesotoga sp.]MDD4824995.1 hypothetical protein [Mesotoga sp.]MDD5682362.1 hypothetical protein [Mesotoga sp.]
MKKTVIFFSMIIIFAVSTFAHIPTFLGPDDFVNGAYLVRDIDLSQIFYYILSEGERIVITFEGSIGMQFHMLFGVPKENEGMESTKDFRPELTVYDPDRNAYESFVLESIEPEIMYEFFGDTHSYLYVRHDSTLTKDGLYSIEIEATDPGRVWITFGLKEKFTASQIASIPKWIREIREFHYLTGLAKWEMYGLGIAGILSAASILLIFL